MAFAKTTKKTDPYEVRRDPKTGLYHHRYGVLSRVPMQSWQVELFLSTQDAKMGKFYHWRNAVKLAWPNLEINPWLEWQAQTFLSDDYVSVRGGNKFRAVGAMGCASAGKTHFSALASLLWWIPACNRSIVILTSTTKDKIRQRVWPVIQNLWFELQERWEVTGPHLLSSKTMLQHIKGDDKFSIFAQAVRDGETQKAIENIKGQHAERIMLVIDEAPMTPEAVLQTIPNLRKGCKEFVVLAIGNALSHLDPLGLFCEPKGGWKSVTVEDTEWRTKGVNTREHPWQVDPGVCLHFDGAKSPNVLAKKTLYQHVYSWEDWLTATATAEGQQTLQHWSNDRGFPAPDGVLRTVLSEALVDAHDGRGKHTFISSRTPVASLDPSLGGDACTAYFGSFGDIEPHKTGIQIHERVVIQPVVNLRDKDDRLIPIEYQIAKRFADECDKRGVTPSNAGVEGDGIGHGIASVLAHTWGDVITVYSGGAPSEMPVSETDPRTAKDAYDRRITELCFTVQGYVKSNQLKGLTEDAILQFSSREYEPVGGKVRVEKKDDVKKKIGRSCDDADAVCIMCEVVRQKTGGPQGTHKPKHGDDWRKFATDADAVYRSPQLDDSEEENQLPDWMKELVGSSMSFNEHDDGL